MDVLLAALAGVLLGALAAALLLRRGAPEHRADTPREELPFRAVLDALLSGAVVLDASDKVLFANTAARGLDAVRGSRLAVPELNRLVGDVRRLGRPVMTEIDLGDSAVHAQACVAGADGKVVLLLEDVSEARRVDAVRRDFVANVSHELKTPVGALSLLAEAVQEGCDDAEAVRRFAGRMVHESHRLARLVQELIDLSRLQGAEPLRPAAPVHVSVVVGEAIDRVRLAAASKAIDIVVGGELDLRLRGDESQLVTAVANLLDNAVAYSAPGTQVSVGARLRDGEVEVSVKDEGIGIGPDDVERIFERFYRADPARSRETGGTGLGLAIVKHIATNHGGRVSVWSTEGVGSTFTLHLPPYDPVPAEVR